MKTTYKPIALRFWVRGVSQSLVWLTWLIAHCYRISPMYLPQKN